MPCKILKENIKRKQDKESIQKQLFEAQTELLQKEDLINAMGKQLFELQSKAVEGGTL